MVHYHLIDLVITDVKIFVSNGVIGRSIAVQSIGTCRPQICTQHMQMRDLFSMAGVKFEEIFASFSHTFYL